VVYLATYGPIEVAAKSSATAEKDDDCKELLREALRLHVLSNPAILKCYGVCVKQDVTYMLLERCHCTLRAYLDRYGAFSPGLAVRLTMHLAFGLSQLHSAGLVHRDVKTGNAMLSREVTPVARLADLGSARRLKSLVTSVTSNTSSYGIRGSTGTCSRPTMNHKM